MKRSFKSDVGYVRRNFEMIGEKLFPDRELMLRTNGRVRFLRISRQVQVGLAGVALVAFGWAAYTTTSLYLNKQLVAVKDSEIVNARMRYRLLLSDVSSYQRRSANLNKELAENHGMMLKLVEKNSALKQDLKSTENKLQSTNQEKQQIAGAREGLNRRLGEIEQQMGQLNAHNFELKGNLSSVSTTLDDALHERNQARLRSRELAKRVAELKSELAELHKAEESVLAQLTRRTAGSIDDIKQVLGRTGLNADKILASIAKRVIGQGGPFIAAGAGDAPADRLRASIVELAERLGHLDELRKLAGATPLASPLDYFSINSHYGKRRDPINGRWSAHYGLDLGSARRSRVYVTAPGVVTFAGWKGRYGRVVEVTHGMGFKTRYGHLRKILVKKGQKVDYRAKLGLLGNSGRSTGSHLHYEIYYKGVPRNPWKFIKAGRYVYKG